VAELLTIGVDYSETVRMFEAFGMKAQARVLAVAFITANAIKAQAVDTMRKGRPFTSRNVAVEPRRRSDGYAVLMNRNVKDTGGASGAAFASAKSAQRHVGKWLEFGTLKMTAKPWLFPAAAREESAYLQRVIEAVERAKAEAGGG
jgi:hypothetical protein